MKWRGRARVDLCAVWPRLRPLVADTSLYLHRAMLDGRRVMFEGAQGTLLDIDHGTYPFVTSSNATAGGAATGLGIGPESDRHRARRGEGVHDPRRQRAAADRAHRSRWANGCARPGRSTARRPDGRAAAAGSMPWPCATPCASTASTPSRSPSSTCSTASSASRCVRPTGAAAEIAHRDAGRLRAARRVHAHLRDAPRVEIADARHHALLRVCRKKRVTTFGGSKRSAESRRRSSPRAPSAPTRSCARTRSPQDGWLSRLDDEPPLSGPPPLRARSTCRTRA